MNEFEKKIQEHEGRPLRSSSIDILQVNVGLRCNQRCAHCHLEASPVRREMMDRTTLGLTSSAADEIKPHRVDITGGAPELNPHLKPFVRSLFRGGHPIQVRTNLTVMLEPGMEDMSEFLRDHHVRLVASLPCYLEQNVDRQRGQGTYAKSIEIIRRLNRLGYGNQDDLGLDLVYNPVGPFLPTAQSTLEADYRRELKDRFGITFTRLLTITNMPIGRYGEILRRENNLNTYMQLLKDVFNPRTVEELMCRRQISVGWDGTLYDCDFNMALHLPINHGAPNHIRAFEPSLLATRRIVTGEHCFGCTAGHGSSCGGSLA
jgi:radical SAM/Cys-rich protein